MLEGNQALILNTRPNVLPYPQILGQFPSTKSQAAAFKSIGPGLLGKETAKDLQILPHFWAEVPEPVDIAIAAAAKSAVGGVGK